MAYCREHHLPFTLEPSRARFRFGSVTHDSLGTIHAKLPIPGRKPFRIDVVPIDVPFLFGLDLMDVTRATPNILENQMEIQIGSETDRGIKSLPLTRKHGHVYIEWEPGDMSDNFFTSQELTKLHRQFYHPSAEKLNNLLRRANPKDVSPETHQLIQAIVRACDICQKTGPKPRRFKVTFPEVCVFNRKLAIDLCWIFGDPVLHIVDLGTNFNSASFLSGESTDACWKAFLECWVTMYTGYPETIRADQGSIFKSKNWKTLCDEQGIDLQLSGIEDHHSLGAGEQQHYPLRNICGKIRMEYPRLDKRLILRLAVKAMNDTLGPSGLVPSLLVFGSISRIPNVNAKHPDQQERLRAMTLARQEYDQWVCQERIRRALRFRTPEAAFANIHAGDSIFVFREHPGKYTGEWKGPYTVATIVGKKVFVDFQGTLKPFSVDQVKKNLSPSFTQEELDAAIHLTESFTLNKTTAALPEVQDAIQREVAGIHKFGIVEKVKIENIPKSANIIPSRFLTVWKIDSGSRRCKARWVAGGHVDNDRNALVHNLTTPKGSTVRMALSLAASFGWSVWTYDVTQAYLQSDVPFSRDVYLKPPPHLDVPAGTIFKLNKAIYGLSDAGDDWGLANTYCPRS